MNELDIQSNPFLQSISNAAKQAQAEQQEELGQDAFLKLMIAQLENQDPLSPAENGEFIAQLAQFSSVEGITNLNSRMEELIGFFELNEEIGTTSLELEAASLDGLATINSTISGLTNQFNSTRALEASSLVGRQVEIDGSVAALPENGSLRGTLLLPENSERVVVTVFDQEGEELYVKDYVQQPGGSLAFGWDGRDREGNQQPPGAYQVRAEALVDGNAVNVPFHLSANVDSVSIGSAGNITLNLQNIGSVSIDEVTRFL